MKITVEEIANQSEVEIVIKCRKRVGSINTIVDTLKLMDRVISAKKDGDSFVVRPFEVLYFDSVNDKVFCYTDKDVYETPYKLYELENTLSRSTFLRINKSMIANVNKIEKFKSASNGRMEATLINGERVEISRNYVAALKLILGGIK